ncbi:MAG: hypothetical protein AAF363_22365 [Bacteroidota bacterium]
MKCVSGKIIHYTEKEALEALVQNHIRVYHNQNSGPVNIYECKDCNYFHLTSKGDRHEILDDPEVKKRIDLERQSIHWESKLRR